MSQSLPPLSGSTTDVQCNKNTGLIPPPLDYVAVGCTQNSGFEQIPERSFDVDIASGQITTTGAVPAINFERRKSYTLIIKIADNPQETTLGLSLTDEAAVVITIVNVNERPNVENQERSVEENTPRTTKVGVPIPSTDPDNIPLGTYTLEEQQLLYKLTLSDGSPSPEFKIGACGGQGKE